MTTTVPRQLVVLAMLLALLASFALFNASPAAADRCQPEELVIGSSPIDERDNPVCAVLIYQVYPFLCDDSTTLLRCLGSINPDPTYEPPLVPPYDPQADRIVCNTLGFVFGTSNCS
jgi:hypothetical protein